MRKWHRHRWSEGRLAMAKIAILSCKRSKDHSCIACAKCFKGVAKRNG